MKEGYIVKKHTNKKTKQKQNHFPSIGWQISNFEFYFCLVSVWQIMFRNWDCLWQEFIQYMFTVETIKFHKSRAYGIMFLKYTLMEKAMAALSSTLAWKIPWTEESGRLQSMGSLRVGQDWVTSLLLFTLMHWRRKWQPTPVFLPGESQGRGEPGGLPSLGSHRVGHDWSNIAAVAAAQQ